MATVNYFSIFAFVCLAVSLHGSVAQGVSSLKPLVSVREYPKNIHRCSAVFVTQKHLVTTASCLLCVDKCQLFVKIVDKSLRPQESGYYNVTRTFIHPDYEINPRLNDVGIIEVNPNIYSAVRYDLPDSDFDPSFYNSTFYSWQFTKNREDFILQQRIGNTISNELCGYFYREYIPDQIICFQSNDLLSFGYFDHGSPIITNIDDTNYIVGMFAYPDEIHDRYVFKLQSLIPFLDWINSIVNPNVDSEYNGDQNYRP